LTLCALALPAASAQAWSWPVAGTVLRPFSFDPAHPYAGGQHRGIDIGADEGAGVVAPADGTVSFAGTVPGGGKTVSIVTPFGYTATLLHLGSIEIKRGNDVVEGLTVIGTVGAAAEEQPYVYFGVRVTGEPQGYVDPLTLLPAPALPDAATSAAADAATTAVGETHPAPSQVPPPTAVDQPPAATDSAPTPPTATNAAPSTTWAAEESSDAASGSGAPASASQASAVTTSAQAVVATPPPTAQPALQPSITDANAASPAATRGAKSSVSIAAPAVALQPLPRTTSGSDVAAAREQHRARTAARDAEARPSGASQPLSARRIRSGERRAAAGRSAPSNHGAASGTLTRGALLGSVCGALCGALVLLVRRRARTERAKPARIMSVPVGRTAEEDSRRTRVAVRERAAASGARRRVRRTGGHLRALPPAERQRRPDGEWDGRARYACDGLGGPRGRLAA
jgi:murein DD-endopeptidase MepM/ murein hydrolase activator NlpD